MLGAGVDTNDSVEQFINDIGGRSTFSRWSLLYCGGAKSVADDLSKLSKVYGVDLRVESFDWWGGIKALEYIK